MSDHPFCFGNVSLGGMTKSDVPNINLTGGQEGLKESIIRIIERDSVGTITDRDQLHHA